MSNKKTFTTKEFAAHCRKAIPEGIVLLENNGSLPLSSGENIALFGRSQFEYLKSGSGSGGRVNCPYVTNIYDEIKSRVTLDQNITQFYRDYIVNNPFDEGDGWKPCFCQIDAVPSEDLVRDAATRNDKAIYVICRNVGESFDYEKVEGNWYLSHEEDAALAVLSKYFKNVIVLINSGNIMDMSWVKKYNIGTVAYVWQGGQEGGAGTVDALMGDIAPSGRLTDTIAISAEDYPCDDCFGDLTKNVHKEDIYVGYRYFETFAPDRVLYPFGFGLNYTEFNQTVTGVQKDGDTITISVVVENVGNYSGKDVVQVYFSAPQGALGKAARELIAFKKTDTLMPGESQEINLAINVCDMVCYDDCGKSGYPFAWVLESGEYNVCVGQNVRDAKQCFAFSIDETRLVKQCVQALAPVEEFDRMINLGGKVGFEKATLRQYDLAERIKNNLPQALEITGDRGITLQDVAKGKNTLDEFVAQFDAQALTEIVRGEGFASPKATYQGTASCFAGITKSWSDAGVPVVTTCDGPSGIRMESSAQATCIPVGALLASAWAPELFEDMYKCLTDEMKHYDIDILLGPGMNIHRSGLCGRNFEYFSEDPYLTGVYADKLSSYFTKNGFFATLKHFAVNSQEISRKEDNEVLSERALREIYLKAFEIAVKGGSVKSIMTSYNRVNGMHTSGSYDLTTTILRDDWGYDGFVMTDWGTTMDDPNNGTDTNANLATMVKAQNDIYKVKGDSALCEDDQLESIENGYLTIGELQRCAKNLLIFTMQTNAFRMGKTTNVNELSDAHELVYHKDLRDVELKICTDHLKIYQGEPRRRIQLQIEEGGMYCGEILYNFKGTMLEQKNIFVYVDDCQGIRMVGIVTGKLEKQRFRIYVDKNSKIYFQDGIEEFNLYKL
ncbi:MAG: glycoside hydrolase family 3 protein [Clostridia bacterium]|nr:glycoside hydrolase family 3 protein [Clostridia bacterium]